MSDQSDAPVKRGPGRPPNPPAPPAPIAPPKPVAKSEPAGTMVTYRPRHGDNLTTVFHGHTFEANKPLAVTHAPLLAQAKANPWFEVAGHDRSAPADADDLPTDSDGYRRYAVAWFKSVTSSAEMAERWDYEENLRKECGVGTDDLEYLNSLFVPRMAELTKAEA